jgi:copper chaperone CopZ
LSPPFLFVQNPALDESDYHLVFSLSGGSFMYKITVGVDGMACNMCESHVNDAVRKAFAVKSVKSDHKAKRTVIISETPIAEEAIRSAIGATGYTVTSFSSAPYEKQGFLARLFG